MRIEVNHQDLAYVQSRLKGMEDQAPKTLKEAINITAQRARRLLETKVRERYTAKYAGMDNHMRIYYASISKLYATISNNGRPLTQPRFHISRSKTAGVSTEVIKGGGLKSLTSKITGNKAFVGKAKNSGVPMVYQRDEKARLPLNAFHGPSIPKMLEKVYGGRNIADTEAKQAIEKMYHENVEAAIERVLATQ